MDKTKGFVMGMSQDIVALCYRLNQWLGRVTS
jgi:hypothetical protein